ncbi:MAG: ABC transporter ATP-binding protein [Ignavibacteriales bacterium]|nr:MAG: ABC transporter ATP-binding protein [Ignavibacteriales bacterium]
MNNDYILVKNLNKSFERNEPRKLEVFTNLSFSLKKGQIVALLGPSGCGKTTLLKLLAGLLKPTSGEILIDGLDPLNIDLRKKISLMFQQPNLLPWQNVKQNIALPLKLLFSESDARSYDKKIDEILKLVGLTNFADYYPHQISGGMQSRVALARAVIFNPEILLLDEPFATLDALTREDMQMLLLDILKKTSATTIIVTHSIEEAIILSDEVFILSSQPSRIIQKLLINLPRPRTANSRFENDLVVMRKEILDYLSQNKNNIK